MFTLNDFWFIEWYHFASTHCTVEIVYLAAIRTLSEDHPLMGVLNRRKETIHHVSQFDPQSY